MHLPDLNTRTDAAVALLPKFGLDGAPCFLVVIKQRFRVRHMGKVKREPGAKVRLVDEPWEPDVPSSSIRYPADACLRKPSKQLKVFGLRVWFKGALGVTLTDPRPFHELPLRWEYAYGGMDTSNPKKLAHEPRNPVGRGVVADPDTLLHQPGPQIEDPADLIRGVRSRPTPAGVGAIGPGFEPRLRYAGTHDDHWQTERMPLPPLDFDERHNQVAAPGLICPSYLRGGERVSLVGVCEEGPLQCDLPKLAFHVGSRTADGAQEHRPVLDTVLLEPNTRQFEMTWRALVPVPKRARELESVTVYEKEWL